MSLSCSCDVDWDPEPGEWTYWFEDDSLDFEKLSTSKRKRCCSCKELIDIGSLCIKYSRFRHPRNEIESRIYGIDWECFEEPIIKIANHFHCEKCGEIFLNLTDLGFECLWPGEDMNGSLKEYHEMTGFKKDD